LYIVFLILGKIPAVSINQDLVIPNFSELSSPFKDLNMISRTFLKIGQDWISDPTDLEEEIMDSMLTVLLSYGSIQGLWKEGSMCDDSEIDACLGLL
jgi:exosome complex RNA-binding protein Rrp42 (RNase PH superfamily)